MSRTTTYIHEDIDGEERQYDVEYNLNSPSQVEVISVIDNFDGSIVELNSDLLSSIEKYILNEEDGSDFDYGHGDLD